MAYYFQIFPPLIISYQLFIFTNHGNFQVRTWVWRKFSAENYVNFQGGDWTGVKWSSQSRKTNFLTLPDLAFGFINKRSGNEITRQPDNFYQRSWQCFASSYSLKIIVSDRSLTSWKVLEDFFGPDTGIIKLVVIKDYESAFDAVTVESALNNTFPG